MRRPTSRPSSMASSRAWVSTATRRLASWSISWSPPSTRVETTAMVVMMPMMTTTTSTSSSVKPEERRAARRRRRGLLDVPVADVGIGAFTVGLAVRAERVEVELASGARGDVEVVASPRVLLQAVDVAAFLPVADVRVGRLLHEGLQPLLGGGVAEVVHAVQVERRLVSADVLLRLGDARVVDAADDVRRNERSQDAQDDHDDHDLDQGESALKVAVVRGVAGEVHRVCRVQAVEFGNHSKSGLRPCP